MSDEGNGRVVIGAKEVYDLVMEVRDEMRDMRAERKQDAALAQESKARISKLERAQYGVIAGLIAGYGTMVYYGMKH